MRPIELEIIQELDVVYLDTRIIRPAPHVAAHQIK